MRYNFKLTKVLEDGTEVDVAVYKNEPGWFVSPMLKALADQTKEPKPKPVLKGEVPMFDMKPGNPRKTYGRAA